MGLSGSGMTVSVMTESPGEAHKVRLEAATLQTIPPEIRSPPSPLCSDLAKPSNPRSNYAGSYQLQWSHEHHTGKAPETAIKFSVIRFPGIQGSPDCLEHEETPGRDIEMPNLNGYSVSRENQQTHQASPTPL